MKRLVFILFFFASTHPLQFANAQNNIVFDSLKNAINESSQDSSRVRLLNRLSYEYLESNLDSSLKYGSMGYQLSLQSKEKRLQVNGLDRMGTIFWRTGNTEKSIELLLRALHISQELNDSTTIAMVHFDLANAYNSQRDYPRAMEYYFKTLRWATARYRRSRAFMTMGSIYLTFNRLDSALIYAEKADSLFKSEGPPKYSSACQNLLGNIQLRLNHPILALECYRQGVKAGIAYNNLKAVCDNYLSIARFFRERRVVDSTYHYALAAYYTANQLNSPSSILETSKLLKDIFKENNKLDSAFKYQEIMTSANDSISNIDRVRQVQILSFAEEQRLQDLINEKNKFRNNVKLWALLSSLLIFLIIALFLYRNNRLKQKSNNILKTTLAELKSTQSQLIQSEKMASLGELTAGIAHEIQNPLNFVNNFSEINKELIDEASLALKSGNANGAVELLSTLRENEDKISNHGKRADRIVKGMLQHSRETKGQKEPTDLNYLADEYFKLSYQGQRAKDKSFNATLKTDFDSSIGKINMVPQDIGRVLLNLYNNAFYVVSEKKKLRPVGYEPTVSISTQKINGKVEIRVKDNGNGIPEKVKEKIFQPFFTTKPTGQGTGLGLSLSYDIIKAHGGEIKVDTKEGEGCEFIIQLPF